MRQKLIALILSCSIKVDFRVELPFKKDIFFAISPCISKTGISISCAIGLAHWMTFVSPAKVLVAM
jgi:hypothetical protein